MRCERLVENEIMRRRQVEEFESSKMSMKDWCENNGISVATLRYWRQRLKNEGSHSGAWVEIGELGKDGAVDPCAAMTSTGNGNVTISVGRFNIEVTENIDTEALRTALTVAASLC
jgi:hypothetical protein